MKLENNSVHIKEDLPYKTMYRMAPKSSKEFEFISKHYYNFMIVRHPFRRLISAYNNRVKGCEMSAKWYTTKELLSRAGLFNRFCVLWVHECLFSKFV